MRPFTITPNNIANAELHAVIHGGPRSHRDNLIGALGEIKVLEWLNEGQSRNTWRFSESKDHYDIVGEGGLTVEVKTQLISVPPLPHYKVNISAKSWEHKQNVDAWIFVMVHKSLLNGWIVSLVKKEHRQLFDFHLKGEFMYETRPNSMDVVPQYLNDTYTCEIGKLNA